MRGFEQETLDAIGRQREVRFTTRARRTGKPRSVTYVYADPLTVMIRQACEGR